MGWPPEWPPDTSSADVISRPHLQPTAPGKLIRVEQSRVVSTSNGGVLVF